MDNRQRWLAMVIETSISHSHLCAHCDTTWSCHRCIDPDAYHVRKHGCKAQLDYSKRMAMVMSQANRKCKYGCVGECNHARTNARLPSSCKSGYCGECKHCMMFE